jgi:hypothetical protein
MNCLLCNSEKPYCFSVCDKCETGLCKSCQKLYCDKRGKLKRQLLKDCSLCKTNFYDFCDFCHNQTLSYIIGDYASNLLKETQCDLCVYDEEYCELNRCELCEKKFHSIKEELGKLRKLESSRNKKLGELDESIKKIIGDPNEYLKEKFNFCDCESLSHCYIIASKQTKQELGIAEFELYERGISNLYCKSCFISQLGYEPITQVI